MEVPWDRPELPPAWRLWESDRDPALEGPVGASVLASRKSFPDPRPLRPPSQPCRAQHGTRSSAPVLSWAEAIKMASWASLAQASLLTCPLVLPPAQV